MGEASKAGSSARWRIALGAVVLLGLALRIAGARGGLWLDEAWSAVQAQDVGSPLGIFLRINHDNNHHLNSLWMQGVGLGAPSLVQRLPAILCGTASILLAAALAGRRWRGAGLVTALLFAVSPLLVTLGSEARGYAPMLLALLAALWLADRRIEGEEGRDAGRRLALYFLLGALCQLTILFGFCALAGWAAIQLWRRDGFVAGSKTALALLGPSAAMLALVAGGVFGAGEASGGFRFGDYAPFTWPDLAHGLAEVVRYALGVPVASRVLLAVPLAVLVLARAARVRRQPLLWLGMLGFPLALAVLRVANVAHARYELLVGMVMLLALGEAIAVGLARRGAWRITAAAGLAAIVIASLAMDLDLAANRRGDVSAAVAAIAAHQPRGARVTIDRASSSAVLRVAAAQKGYPLEVVAPACPPSSILFLQRFDGEAMPEAAQLCGHRYRPIASARAHGLSGADWTVYAIAP